MNLTTTTAQELPRLRGLVEVLRLSQKQYEQMLVKGILHPRDAVEFRDGYLVTRQNGIGATYVPTMAALWPLSLDQYYRMIAEGVVLEGAPIEFLEGFFVAKDRGTGPGLSHGFPHARSLRRTSKLCERELPVMVVSAQLPVHITSAMTGLTMAPEPDVAVCDGPEERYNDHHPRQEEIRLVVEIADTSLVQDRNYKAQIYAESSLPLYWIINLNARQVEVHCDPDPAASHYRSVQVFSEDQTIVLAWPGITPVSIQVRDLLP